LYPLRNLISQYEINNIKDKNEVLDIKEGRKLNLGAKIKKNKIIVVIILSFL